MARRLGDILVEQGSIARDELERFAPLATGKIGQFLRAHTLIRSRPLAQAIAEQQGLPYLALDEQPCDPHLFLPHELGFYQEWLYLPHRQLGERLTIATPSPTPALKAILERHYRRPIDFAVISQRDFTRAIANLGATSLTRRARLTLRRRFRHLVADRVLLKPQIYGLAGCAILLLLAGMFFPASSWYALLVGCNLFYLTTLAFKLQLYLQGNAEAQEIAKQAKALDEAVLALEDATLPVYTILVPVYREGFGVLTRLVGHLHALQYPRERLDIKLICEADDYDTIAALKACKPPETMEIILVPPSHPRTKPKACNVALQQIRGEYVVIFDAEDAPEPMQLKRAVALFRQLPTEVVCLQAPLNYYNRDENLLTRLFAIEYSTLFRLMLPALQRMRLPIPLGGTSNHVKASCLLEAGGWDAFNVTEDADLGMRFAYLGYRTQMLPSITLEEAPIRLKPWLLQRTRWIKGYIQTWLVYMRDPHELKIRLNHRGYYGFLLFIGAPALTFLLAPLFWATFIISLMGWLPQPLSPWLLGLCSVSFVSGILSHLLFARSSIHLEKWENMQLAQLTYPFYWLLHSLAAARALWQLFTQPHYWDKTVHGVSKLFK
jgi:cellulose synthase/poly-beta-1,6-N-acetylglucosamine synthase-like glycosyltransferase